MRRRIAFILTFVCVCATGIAADQQGSQPTVDEVVARASRYVGDYARTMAFVIATEEYGQWMEIPGGLHPMHRMLVSEYALVRVGDDWEAFRDVHNVDGQPVTGREDRLQKLFLEGGEGAVRQARQIADESARYNMGQIRRNFNTPTMALFFLREQNVGRFKFKKAGDDTVDGVKVWKLRYEEVKKPTIIRTSAAKDMPVTGTFWIDPSDGRVLRSHMEMKSETKLGMDAGMDVPPQYALNRNRSVNSLASISVTYKQDEKLGSLVPAEMRETYEGPFIGSLGTGEDRSRISCRATYADFKRFETSNKLIVK